MQLFIFWFCTGMSAQTYTSYFTGNSTDKVVTAQGGVCMMGGATEHDNAMRWFLQQSSGGDVLVIRASGSDGYNDYLYSELGEIVNSVETIVFHSASAAQDAYVLDRIDRAEAIWIAGGDQWDYVSYWRDSPVAVAINSGIQNRNIVIGGTSAGMAILGGAYFSAENGTVTSEAALANPYNSDVAVDNTPFLEVPFMQYVITDTHYDDPDRRGRHLVFLARAYTDFGMLHTGIGAEEYTAVCVDVDGLARVYGDYPDFDDKVFFLVPNCDLVNPLPEDCTAGQPLNWDAGGAAVKVYQVNGTPTGLYTFDLGDWLVGSGGDWQDWWVVNGDFQSQNGADLTCSIVSTEAVGRDDGVAVFPNPVSSGSFVVEHDFLVPVKVQLWATSGQKQKQWAAVVSGEALDLLNMPSGLYYLQIEHAGQCIWKKMLVQR